jgi:hypothetical protein
MKYTPMNSIERNNALIGCIVKSADNLVKPKKITKPTPHYEYPFVISYKSKKCAHTSMSLPWYICKDRGEKPRLRRGKCRNAPAA